MGIEHFQADPYYKICWLKKKTETTSQRQRPQSTGNFRLPPIGATQLSYRATSRSCQVACCETAPKAIAAKIHVGEKSY